MNVGMLSSYRVSYHLQREREGEREGERERERGGGGGEDGVSREEGMQRLD